jgi:hypothetical protein
MLSFRYTFAAELPGHMNNQAHIFIAGPSRSGTTLTSELLGRHSRVFTHGPIGFLNDVDALRKRVGDQVTEAAAREAVLERVAGFYSRLNAPGEGKSVENLILGTEIASKMLLAHSHLEMSALFLDAQARQAGKCRWVMHATGSVYHLPRILSFFPAAKFILCTRNPLDYLVSYRDSYRRAERRNRVHEVERLRKLYHPVVTSLLWLASMRAAKRAIARYPKRVLLNRYEDMVADPEGQIRRLCTFVGVEFESAMLAIEWNNSSENVKQKGIFASSVGRWREKLPEADAFICQMICRKEMRRFGYSLVPLRADFREISWRIVTSPIYAWLALSANRTRHASTTSYLRRRISALARR